MFQNNCRTPERHLGPATRFLTTPSSKTDSFDTPWSSCECRDRRNHVAQLGQAVGFRGRSLYRRRTRREKRAGCPRALVREAPSSVQSWSSTRSGTTGYRNKIGKEPEPEPVSEHVRAANAGANSDRSRSRPCRRKFSAELFWVEAKG